MKQKFTLAGGKKVGLTPEETTAISNKAKGLKKGELFPSFDSKLALISFVSGGTAVRQTV